MIKSLRIVLLGLWNIWFYMLAGVGLILCFPLLIVFFSKKNGYKYVYWLARHFWSPMILYGMGFWPKITSLQTLEKNQNYIFIANHLSMIDIMMMFCVSPKPYVFVGKKELSRLPVFGWVYKRVAILVDRDNIKSRKNVYAEAQQKLDLGYSICIYPEGLVPEPEVFLAPFKNGAFSLAIQYQIPIVPVTLPDCKKRFPFQFSFKYWIGKPGRVRATIHPMVETKGLTQKNLMSLKQRVHSFMREKLHEEGLK